jgi:predicted ArsR family transcriptional regulator
MMRVILRPHPQFEAGPEEPVPSAGPERSRKSTAERRGEILAVLRAGELGTREIAAAVGLRERQTRRLLDAMERDGLVLPNDEAENSPYRKYRVA